MSSFSLRVAGLCVLGLVVSASVAYLAANLVSEDIGLSSESLSEIRELEPRGDKEPARDRPTTTRSSTTSSTTTTQEPPATTTVPTPPSGDDSGSDDDSGGDDSSGSGSGDD